MWLDAVDACMTRLQVNFSQVCSAKPPKWSKGVLIVTHVAKQDFRWSPSPIRAKGVILRHMTHTVEDVRTKCVKKTIPLVRISQTFPELSKTGNRLNEWNPTLKKRKEKAMRRKKKIESTCRKNTHSRRSSNNRRKECVKRIPFLLLFSSDACFFFVPFEFCFFRTLLFLFSFLKCVKPFSQKKAPSQDKCDCIKQLSAVA